MEGWLTNTVSWRVASVTTLPERRMTLFVRMAAGLSENGNEKDEN